MVKKIFPIVFSILLFFSFTLKASEKDKLISSLKEKGYSINSYMAEFSSKGESVKYPIKTKGKIFYKNGKGLKIIGEVNIGGKVKGERTVLITPKEFILYNPFLHIEQRADLEKIKSKLGKKFEYVNPLMQFDLRNPFIIGGIDPKETKLEKEEKDAHIFSSVFYPNPMTGQKAKPYKGKFWVDKSNGMLTKIIIFDKGKKIYTTTYKNIWTNIPISDNEFTFSPPKGTKIVDFTEKYLKK